MTVGQYSTIFSKEPIAQRLAFVDQSFINAKLCLIEDCFKVYKLLSAFDGSDRHIVCAGQVFDELYDLSIEELQLHYTTIQGNLSAIYIALTD